MTAWSSRESVGLAFHRLFDCLARGHTTTIPLTLVRLIPTWFTNSDSNVGNVELSCLPLRLAGLHYVVMISFKMSRDFRGTFQKAKRNGL